MATAVPLLGALFVLPFGCAPEVAPPPQFTQECYVVTAPGGVTTSRPTEYSDDVNIDRHAPAIGVPAPKPEGSTDAE
jgi:hypothetical protein